MPRPCHHNLTPVRPRGALVYRTTDQTGIDYSGGLAVPFEAEVYDTSNIWSIAAPTKLIVPAGVTLVQLSGGVLAASVLADTDCIMAFSKGGAQDFIGNAFQMPDTSNVNPRGSITSAPVPVVGGDEFELRWRTVGDTSTDVLANGGVRTFFSMLVLA